MNGAGDAFLETVGNNQILLNINFASPYFDYIHTSLTRFGTEPLEPEGFIVEPEAPATTTEEEITLDFPVNSVPEDTQVELTKTESPVDFQLTRSAGLNPIPITNAIEFEITASEVDSGAEVTDVPGTYTMVIDYSPLLPLPAFIEASLRIFWFNDLTSRWEMIPSNANPARPNLATKTITATLDHFSTYAIGYYEDTTPPETTATLTGDFFSPPYDTFYKDQVMITLEAEDDGYGVEKIEYSLDGVSWAEYTGALIFDTEGEYTLSYRATDLSGEAGLVEETKTMSFKIIRDDDEDGIPTQFDYCPNSETSKFDTLIDGCTCEDILALKVNVRMDQLGGIIDAQLERELAEAERDRNREIEKHNRTMAKLQRKLDKAKREKDRLKIQRKMDREIEKLDREIEKIEQEIQYEQEKHARKMAALDRLRDKLLDQLQYLLSKLRSCPRLLIKSFEERRGWAKDIPEVEEPTTGFVGLGESNLLIMVFLMAIAIIIGEVLIFSGVRKMGEEIIDAMPKFEEPKARTKK